MINLTWLFRRVVAILFTTLVIVGLQNFYIWSYAAKTNPVCYSLECLKLADIYHEGLNLAGDPCNDFYDFACGQWQIYNPRPKYADQWTLDMVLERHSLKDLKCILEDTNIVDSVSKAAKLVYRACMNRPHLKKSSPEDIKEIMKKIGTWPILQSSKEIVDRPWWAIHQYYANITGESALFGFVLSANPDKNYSFILQLVPLESPYGMVTRTKDWLGPELKNYRNFLTLLIKTVTPTDAVSKDNVVQRDLTNVLKLRAQLLKAVNKNDEDDAEFIHVNIRTLQIWYDGEIRSREGLEFNWLRQLQALYNPDIVPLNGMSAVSMHKRYFASLLHILKKTPERVIANHIHLYFAERHLLLNSELKKLLHESVTNGPKPRGTIRYEPERWESCINNHNMKETLAKMYVAKYFTKETKLSVKLLLEVGKHVLKQQIGNSSWVDSTTKKQSINKIDRMKSAIGYPDWFDENIPISIYDAIYLYPLVANARYMQTNHLTVTAGFLRPPVYSVGVPYVVTYGSTLSLLAHELCHAFDGNGILHDEHGREPFWPSTMIRKFKAQAECFVNLYKKIKETEYKEFNVQKRYRHKWKTVNEDIADCMGLKIAYEAYQQMLEKQNGVCPVLPGFEDMGCEQLFFLAFGNSFCFTSTPDAQLRNIMKGIHSTWKTRLNAAVSNMPEFTSAFKCTPEHKLYNHMTCDLWK